MLKKISLKRYNKGQLTTPLLQRFWFDHQTGKKPLENGVCDPLFKEYLMHLQWFFVGASVFFAWQDEQKKFLGFIDSFFIPTIEI